MNKKNVLFLDHAIEMGGAEHSLYYLIKFINKQHIKPILMAPSKSKLANMVNKLGEKVSYNEMDSPKGVLSFLRNIFKIKKYMRENSIEVIYCNTYRTIIYGVMLKLVTSCKVVWHVRDFYNNNLLKSIYSTFSNKIICISNPIAEQFREKDSGKISVIYNGVDLEKYNSKQVPGDLKQELGLPVETLLIGMVGRIDRWKGIHLLIEAANYLVNDLNKKEFVFIIVGASILTDDQSYPNELKEMVQTFNLSKNVVFVGQRSDIPNVMKSFDLTVNYSDNEPFGRVIIESLAMGTPVVVNNTGGAPEIIENVGYGRITKGRDAMLLANAILEETSKEVDEVEKRKLMNKVKTLYDANIPSTKVSEIIKLL
ncbi:hypothetical protein HMPREF3291_04405 [Bacillus sp. HMSC76G11]|nr:hypothetical protein HMPREF3291_04405 [Bacillus sp. HMSC76G11]